MERGPRYSRPTELFLVIAAAIFLGEVIVMFVLAAIPPIPVVMEAFLDGTMITVLMVPFLYFLAYRPMVAEIEWRRKAQEDLIVLNRELDARVDQRTAELSQTNERLERQISKNIQRQEEIRKDREFIRSVVEVAPCLLMILEAGSNRCLFVNGRVEELLGYDAESVVEPGRDFLREVMGPEQYSQFTEVLFTSANLEFSTADLGKIGMRQRSGEWKQMDARYAVLRRDPQGQTLEILLAAMEVQ